MCYLLTTASYSQQIRFLIILLVGGGLSVLSPSARAQTQPSPQSESPFHLLPNYEKVYAYVERMPVFKDGGNEGMLALINKNRPTLPTGAKALFMEFVVDRSGKSTQAKLTTVPGGINIPTSTYQEAARILKAMDFVPGQQNGKPVNVSFTVPLVRSK